MINRYKLYLFFKNGIWIGPIITLFYLLNKMTFTQIFLIASSYKIAVAFLEVPTGAIADKIGHKKSVLIGMLISAIGIFMYPLLNNFLYYIMCEVIIAIGATFISGADEALFYSCLKKENLENKYSKFMGTAKQYGFLSQMIGSLVSIPLFQINPYLPFIISSLLYILGFITFLKFEDDVIKEETKISYLKQITETGKYIFKHKRLRTIILYIALINMTYVSIVFTYTPYMLDVGISESYFGIIFAIFNIVALISAKFTDKFIKLTKKKTLVALGCLLLISYTLLGLIRIEIGIIAILFQQVFRAVNRTVSNKYINKCVSKEKHATILSYLSLLITLLGGAFGVILGVIMDNFNIFETYLILSLITALILFIMNHILNKNL